MSVDKISTNINDTEYYYERVTWQDGGEPPIDANHLNKHEEALDFLLRKGDDKTASGIITQIFSSINTEITSRESAIQSEQTERQTADNTLSERIDTKADINHNHDNVYIKTIPAEYVTDDELNAKGYLTQHQSLANYYKKSETDSAIRTAVNNIKIPTTVSELTDHEDYATKSWVNDTIDDEIAEALSGGNIDLESYVKDEELSAAIQNIQKSIPTKVSDLTDYTNYATKTWVEDKKYLTEHQSLDNYYTKSEVNQSIENAKLGIESGEILILNCGSATVNIG